MTPQDDDRPREKLERLGPAGLGNNELLALVLGFGAYHVMQGELSVRRGRRRSSRRSNWDAGR